MSRSKLAFLALVACAPAAHAQAPDARLADPESVSLQRRVRFAAIGDFGDAGSAEAAVAQLVKGWAPEFIFTLGDNNYTIGSAATIDENVGQYYHEFIAPYLGTYGPGATINRFFPALGNHDWVTPNAQPHLDYFTLPGNERYYDFRRGPVHLFCLDSDPAEPDGITATSIQGQWLEKALTSSNAPFRIVYLHAPPYSSGPHGPSPDLQWPFGSWGADLVMAGDDHVYERISGEDALYVVNGLGGRSTYTFGDPIAGSKLRFSLDFGALRLDATERVLTMQFVTRGGIAIDTFAMGRNWRRLPEVELVPSSSTWRVLDTGVAPDASWTSIAFDDSAWTAGAGELGYGGNEEQTPISFGFDEQNKHITTWFRHTFETADAAGLDQLRIRLLRDDGAVVYVNGSEVHRTNLPAGAITPSTLAVEPIEGSAEDRYVETSIDPSFLVNGTNIIAAEVHLADPASPDLSFDLDLVGVRDVQVLSPTGAEWSYREDGGSPGPGWTKLGFDASSWLTGRAEFGYGDGEETTSISFGPDPQAKPITTYFRREFHAGDEASTSALFLRMLRDDGAVVFLNGAEVYRWNLLVGSVGPRSEAVSEISGQQEADWLETSIDPALLRKGDNVLAVEIHQAGPATDDMSFDLELLAVE